MNKIFLKPLYFVKYSGFGFYMEIFKLAKAEYFCYNYIVYIFKVCIKPLQNKKTGVI